MAEEYKLLANVPFADPEAEAIRQAATTLGVAVRRGPEGAPEVATDQLLIYGFTPDDIDRTAVEALFGLGVNLTLVFTGPDESEPLAPTPIAESMVKVATVLAAVPAARGVLVSDYTADAIILRFRDGKLTLNQDWPGWRERPEVLAVVPAPRTLTPLQGRD